MFKLYGSSDSNASRFIHRDLCSADYYLLRSVGDGANLLVAKII